ncbi:MAG: S1 RNA-binding domain-containing protein [Armatimonadetes bacterium]|nr:S1 RNA-binding domain-containing protein [Armatimonadota bacterium]
MRGKVVRTVPSGAFVRLEDLDAFIPISELAEKRVGKVEDVVKPGDEIEAAITEIRADDRRMTLSVRKMEREKERKRVKEVLKSQDEIGRVTIGDLAGELLRQAVAPAAGDGESEKGSGE